MMEFAAAVQETIDFLFYSEKEDFLSAFFGDELNRSNQPPSNHNVHMNKVFRLCVRAVYVLVICLTAQNRCHKYHIHKVVP